SWRTASSRRSGRGARGSSLRASSASTVVTVTFTKIRLCVPTRRRISASRVTRFDLVTIPISKPECSASSSRMARVTSKRRADGDLLPMFDLLQFRSQERGCVLLDENLSFELHAVAQFQELMGIARIAVLTGKLAPAIRIDGPSERKVATGHHPIEQR